MVFTVHKSLCGRLRLRGSRYFLFSVRVQHLSTRSRLFVRGRPPLDAAAAASPLSSGG